MSLIQTIITEKGTKFEKQGKYTFLVSLDSTKISIKQAIKKLYGLDVTSVRIINMPEKSRIGAKKRSIIKRSNQKKAIITLKDKKKSLDINKLIKEK